MTSVRDVLVALTDVLPGDLNRVAGALGSQLFPAAVVMPPSIEDYSESLSGDDLRFQVRIIVLVSSSTVEGITQLWDYQEVSGEKSVRAAIEADRSLGLDGVHVWVRSTDPLGLTEAAAYKAYGCSFLVEVMLTP